jgi:nucleotide-binding universal stress UspA family protein
MLFVIKKILYTTDLTENSKRALICALDFAKKYHAEIFILHVLEEISPTTRAILDGIGGIDENLLEKRLNEKISYTLKRIEDDISKYCYSELGCDAGQVKSIEVCQGHPEEEILKKVDELECDAIVMGTHGKGALSAALGSVTRRVLRRVKKPVFVIPLLNKEDTSPA